MCSWDKYSRACSTQMGCQRSHVIFFLPKTPLKNHLSILFRNKNINYFYNETCCSYLLLETSFHELLEIKSNLTSWHFDLLTDF